MYKLFEGYGSALIKAKNIKCMKFYTNTNSSSSNFFVCTSSNVFTFTNEALCFCNDSSHCVIAFSLSCTK